MSSINSCRIDVLVALSSTLSARAELVDVKILEGLDGKDIKTETIMLGNIRGTGGEIRDMRPGRKARRDEFELTIWFAAAKQGQKTPLIARQRVLVLLGALEDILADDPTLDGVPGLRTAQLGSYDGPDVESTTEGWQAYVTARVECVSELN